jgi:hypothetical protein
MFCTSLWLGHELTAKLEAIPAAIRDLTPKWTDVRGWFLEMVLTKVAFSERRIQAQGFYIERIQVSDALRGLARTRRARRIPATPSGGNARSA